MIDLDPVTLQGEGEYNLDILKEIVPSDSFLRLQEDVKECQSLEPYDNCTLRTFIELMKEKCRCITLAMNLYDEVSEFI